ncbi:MAG: helix-turn-helix transcriptional regulator [Lactococcus chungangensis]|uniref:Helix-turn-helix transcriptional regulator n=1 Tax=Pseudolactococcus chungangensis TaxID=451457 RepID=A0A847J559_9LACT|nr:helix-turn-helix transcriptional regulator [Lactococcus chungangensis]
MPKLQQLFGKRLRQIRMSKKLTQDDLARITSLSSSFISTLERGVNAPSFSALEAIANALDVEVRVLFDFRPVNNAFEHLNQ